MINKVTITSIEFHNFKAFRHYSIRLGDMNILVGPNNSGKSTILNAFRVLAAGIRRANAYSATIVEDPKGNNVYGHVVPTEGLPISLENVHTDYDENKVTRVVFHCSNKQTLTLYFPTNKLCVLIPSDINHRNSTPSKFQKLFPIQVGFVPVLGPLEHEEVLIQQATVQRNLVTHRASRHFRNYWRYFPDNFDEFAELIRQTWKGMEIQRPELLNYEKLAMFCEEDGVDRELYWAGFGFQIWCQLLTHIVRNREMGLLVVDEPDIYLHPDMQRQILAILRNAGPDILLATHSTEIISEAIPSEIILIDKRQQSATRLKDTDQVQNALEILGSSQNITLTQLARTRRVLFVEGEDFKVLSRFARQLGFVDIANQADFTAVPSEGFSHWEQIKSLAWGIERTLGKSLVLGAVFDRDYRCDEEIEAIKEELRNNLSFAYIHDRKELENYLLVPSVLDRSIRGKIVDLQRRNTEIGDEVLPASIILDKITQPMRTEVQSQYISWRSKFFRDNRSRLDEATINKETIRRFDSKWDDTGTRMEIVPGKETFRLFNQFLRENYKFNLSPALVMGHFKRDEVPNDLFVFLKRLEKFKNIQAR